MTTYYLNDPSINWQVSASTIQTKQNQNLTLDASNSLIRLSRNGVVNASFDTSFNFTNLPNCSAAPTLANQLTNKTYVDSLGTWTTWNPSISGAGWSLGSGTIVARYSSIGKTVNYQVVFTFGSGFTSGVGQSFRFTLPITPAGTAENIGGVNHNAVLLDISTGIGYMMTILDYNIIGVGIMAITSLGTNGSYNSFTGTVPITLAVGDKLMASGTYQAA